jgi:hypothetical protein
VYEAAEAVAAPGRHRRRSERWPFGRLKCESAVRTVAVVVPDVDAQDAFEVATADDQQAVETFRSEDADDAFGRGDRLWRVNGRVNDSDSFAAEDLVEGSAELPVAIVGSGTGSVRRGRCG